VEALGYTVLSVLDRFVPVLFPYKCLNSPVHTEAYDPLAIIVFRVPVSVFPGCNPYAWKILDLVQDVRDVSKALQDIVNI
jgi:hypothetical protein